MQASAVLPLKKENRVGWYLLAIILGILLATTGLEMSKIWQQESTLSHAPVLPILTGVLIWLKRKEIQEWNRFCTVGLIGLVLAMLLHLISNWADIEFLKPFALVLGLFSLVWFLGGYQQVKVVAGALGLLLFTIPWPTSLIGKLQFPMQLISSSYAALFAGLMGLPVHREGVYLSIVPDTEKPPVYTILVAEQCSGLTSLMVLLALGYLIAYFSPLQWWLRATLFLVTIPLALLANAARLTFILAAGASHGEKVAQWVHDHEQPVLIFLCSVGLMGIRHLFLMKGRTHPTQPKPQPDGLEEPPKRRFRLVLANSFLILALLGSFWGRKIEASPIAGTDIFADLKVPYHDWKTSPIEITARERELLEPDGLLMRRYTAPYKHVVDLAVIAGHRKKTIHTPDYCLAGGGWDTIAQHDSYLMLKGKRIRTVRSLLMHEKNQVVAVYFYTDGDATMTSLVEFQLHQMRRRMLAKGSLGALVRFLAPVNTTPEEAHQRIQEFAEETLPVILTRMQAAQSNGSTP